MDHIIAELEKVVEDLYAVRLPVVEAGAYGTVLVSANKIAKLVKEMKEEKAHDADDQPE